MPAADGHFTLIDRMYQVNGFDKRTIHYSPPRGAAGGGYNKQHNQSSGPRHDGGGRGAGQPNRGKHVRRTCRARCLRKLSPIHNQQLRLYARRRLWGQPVGACTARGGGSSPWKIAASSSECRAKTLAYWRFERSTSPHESRGVPGEGQSATCG